MINWRMCELVNARASFIHLAPDVLSSGWKRPLFSVVFTPSCCPSNSSNYLWPTEKNNRTFARCENSDDWVEQNWIYICEGQTVRRHYISLHDVQDPRWDASFLHFCEFAPSFWWLMGADEAPRACNLIKSCSVLNQTVSLYYLSIISLTHLHVKFHV